MRVINRNDCPEFVAQDKAIAREILSPRKSLVRNQSLAEITVRPGISILEHYHKAAEELYYILKGEGQMFIEGEERTVGVGDAIVILPGQRHKITNRGEVDLVMLVTSAPSYDDADQVIV
jgi:mannose-6-phosphate isomerase-like protein (cupin superfamily)